MINFVSPCTVITKRPKNCEIFAQAYLAALSPLIIKSKQKALLKTINSLIKLYQMSTFPKIFTFYPELYILAGKENVFIVYGFYS